MDPKDMTQFTSELTLRDRFAMAALQGLLASDPPPPTGTGRLTEAMCRVRADRAYDLSDAMLAAREAKAGGNG